MFNSVILEVAIGTIFIYLLLSLMCSAANEIIELLLKKRAIDLERGIRELLAPGTASGKPDVVQEFYNHPLVNSLFGGKYETSRIKNTVQRKLMRTTLPSYIPAQTFALALMDLILPGVTAPAANGGPTVAGAAVVTASGTAGATPPVDNLEITLAAPPPSPPAVGATNNPLTPLRSAIATNPLLTDHVKAALTPLLDAAGSDVAKARENIESWFNSSMDRVSSWYKRRTQIVILVVGLFVTVTINADTITIVRRLSTDKSLRESLVLAAEEYARANAEPVNAPTATASVTPTSAPSPAPTTSPVAVAQSSPSQPASSSQSPSVTAPAAVSSSSPVASVSQIPECVSDPNSAACRNAVKYEAILQMIPACKKRESPECKYELNKQQLESLGLPIGWNSSDDPQRKWPGSNWSTEGGWRDQIYWHLVGWILTAFAVSLGAPFWFDLLNKFIVIRSAVKPHEKSLEEGSKG